MPAPPDYAGRRVALLTQHGKQAVLAPALEPALGCRVELVTGFDTDQLGTFTRDTARPGSQLAAARRKARKGMELSGLDLGMASEGSFGADPFGGLFPWNVELVVWIDDRLGIEVVGRAQGSASGANLSTGEWEALAAFARQAGFPAQQLVLRPGGADDPHIEKGIGDWARLRETFDRCLTRAGSGHVFAEADCRAFASPARMERIAQAGADLCARLLSLCPGCGAPGYWITRRTPGLPCAACSRPTASHRSDTWSCVRCTHRHEQARSDRTHAPPGECDRCNP